MNKAEYTILTSIWIKKFLDLKFKKISKSIELIIKPGKISKLRNQNIRKIKDYNNFDFSPDYIAIIELNNGEIEVCIFNRTINAISLKEIGEMNLYSKIANPKFSMIISQKGIPDEIMLIMLDNNKQKQLLTYNFNRSIFIFKLDNMGVDDLTIFPNDKKEEIAI